ncbi:hypothetical protein C1H46_010274 [Malus baccata]|uniref:Terpene synthase N-terminal domain-containing protein n=1 Tax=Malus baccata TaxID=106549 RepID=A0A540MZE8_MALBA|nr:hypothetical protein C1H46_010274 [Malus baccata]
MAHFLQAHSASSKGQVIGDLQVRHAKKLKELKEALANIGENEPLIAVDAMQRLGVDYHFQEEIEAILKKQCTRASGDEGSDELGVVSLRFRLLRQQGYHVTTDAFNKFKNNEEFKVDISGLVGLYEASHLSFPGEETLDEAGRRSDQLLTDWLKNNLDDHQASAVAYSLEYPYHKSLTRFRAKNFLNNFEGKQKWVNVLRELAKLEFNMVESLIRNEVQQDEDQDGNDGSYIACYVNENQGCSDEDARAFVVHRISEEWKFLNKECLSASNPFSASFTKLALNVARMVPLMYDYNSQHSLPSLEENMKSLLSDSFLAQGLSNQRSQA